MSLSLYRTVHHFKLSIILKQYDLHRAGIAQMVQWTGHGLDRQQL